MAVPQKAQQPNMAEAKRENEYWDYSQLDDQQRTDSEEEAEEDGKRHRFEMGTKKHELPYKNMTNLSGNNLREKTSRISGGWR